MKKFKVKIENTDFEVEAETELLALAKAAEVANITLKEDVRPWRIGTVVKALGTSPYVDDGTIGVVRGIGSGNMFAVEFQKLPKFMGHSCEGRVPVGKGRWVFESGSKTTHEHFDNFEVVIY